jgi:hypothetical protein
MLETKAVKKNETHISCSIYSSISIIVFQIIKQIHIKTRNRHDTKTNIRMIRRMRNTPKEKTHSQRHIQEDKRKHIKTKN